MASTSDNFDGKTIARFWLPLQATWLMMAFEGPFIAAVIARLPEAKYNLAAYGVAFALAMIAEAPIIMMLSASVALVTDGAAFRKLRRFTYSLNTAVTAILAVILVPGFFRVLAQDWIGLPEGVAQLTWKAVWLLLPWPAAIGYRRFYQGLLIRSGNTRAVALGTIVRLSSMAATALFSVFFLRLPGAMVGAAALSAGVVMEAAASRFMARRAVRTIRTTEAGPGVGLTYAYIWRFYLPLALTSFLTLAMHPLITFFMGHSRYPIESLAVLPVVNALAYIFRSPGIAFQEVTVALMDGAGKNFRELRNFAWRIGILATAGMAAVTLTPLSNVWLEKVSGLTGELALFAVLPGCIVSLLPIMEAMISLQRGCLVSAHRTWPIIAATAIQVFSLFASLLLLVSGLHWKGAVAAALSQVLGYLNAILFLVLFGLRLVPRGR